MKEELCILSCCQHNLKVANGICYKWQSLITTLKLAFHLPNLYYHWCNTAWKSLVTVSAAYRPPYTTLMNWLGLFLIYILLHSCHELKNGVWITALFSCVCTIQGPLHETTYDKWVSWQALPIRSPEDRWWCLVTLEKKLNFQIKTTMVLPVNVILFIFFLVQQFPLFFKFVCCCHSFQINCEWEPSRWNEAGFQWKC